MSVELAAQVIDGFDGPYRYLSNFSGHPVDYEGISYPTAEHAFAAAKTTDPKWKRRILDAPTPGEAKREGRRRELPLREDWDRVRVAHMAAILRSKFTQNPQLRAQLLATGDSLLIEGNDWGDDFWGRCRRRRSTTSVGQNMLGRLLMRLRSDLRGDPDTRWYRAALTGHREKAIDDANAREWVRDELARIAVKLRDEHSTSVALTGLAIGSDTWWAQAAEAAGLDLWGYQPFPEQADRWNRDQRAEHQRLRDICSRLTVVGPGSANYFYADRNEIMVGDAGVVVAVYDPRIRSGGTHMTLSAFCIGMTVIRVNIEARRTTLCTHFPGL